MERLHSPQQQLALWVPTIQPIDQAQIVAIATAVAQAQVIAQAKIQAQASVQAASPASSKHNTQNSTLSNYLDFAGVVEDKDMILHILTTNGVVQYHLFKGNILTHNQLLKAGLNIGTIAKLRTSVNKYKCHLLLSPAV
jgi:hypothetical protein